MEINILFSLFPSNKNKLDNMLLRGANKLRIQYLSDIHIEFLKPHSIDALLMRIVPKAPVLVLAGDIGVCGTPEYSYFLTSVSKKFEHTFFIHGNHEYYLNSLPRKNPRNDSGIFTDQKVNHAKSNAGKYGEAVLCSKMIELENDGKLHFLHNSTYDLANKYRFIGTTLWSKIESKKHLITDFEAIPWMFPEYCNYLHKRSRDFIAKEIEKAKRDNVTPIVITHHLPSFGLVDLKYLKYGKFNQCFASESDDLIDESVAAWIYGHTHEPKNIIWKNGRTQMACNPVGYPDERSNVDYGMTLEIQ